MRALLNKAKVTTTVQFLGETLEVVKLSTKQVKDFQKEVDKLRKGKDDATDAGIAIQHYIVRNTVVGAEDMTTEELESFPMGEFAQLVQDILEAVGLKGDSDAEKGNA